MRHRNLHQSDPMMREAASPVEGAGIVLVIILLGRLPLRR